MVRCTGACCNPVYIRSHTREELRRGKDIDRNTQQALIWTLFRPAGQDYPGWHYCQALTTEGCVLSREDRPHMCTGYPYGGAQGMCHSCGSCSDAESRGVALMVVPCVDEQAL